MLLAFARGYSYEHTKGACLRTERQPVSNVALARWGSILRKIVSERVSRFPKIGGVGCTVQIDEALLRRRKYHVGRKLTRTWVLGMVDGSGRIRHEVCPKRDAATLHGLIRKYVRVGSTIHTDEWRAYNGPSELGYVHATINHSRRFIDGGVHTQRIEAAWRWIRRTFSRGGIRHALIPERLAELVWRRECTIRKMDAIDSLLELCASALNKN